VNSGNIGGEEATADLAATATGVAEVAGEDEAPDVMAKPILADGGEDARRDGALALVHRNRIIRACQDNTSPNISASIRKS
jgi:hypothetical protein